MISWEKALKLISNNIKQLSSEKVDIVKALGMVLAENVYSTIDMPPFNKSAMDGYALKSKDFKKIPIKLKCIGAIAAGKISRTRIKSGECIKIMTGAPLPKGADSVVMIEDTQKAGKYVEINGLAVKNQNVCFAGEDIKRGQKIFSKGEIIDISSIGALAAIGRKFIKVIKKPQVAVLNTGEEIISLGKKLVKNKIYNSNGPQLCSFLVRDGINPKFLGIAKDNYKNLENFIREGLKNDVLLISGGVSMGDYDLVPLVLRKLGVKEIFHKIKVKPGKPLFFGVKNKKIIFGIPGNPVSNFLIYLALIRQALRKMSGHQECKLCFKKGIVVKRFVKKTGRKHFVLVEIFKKDQTYHIVPLSSHGSADIFSLSKADGFMMIEEGVGVVNKGSTQFFITWKEI